METPSNWEGILKWSLSQSDGTGPTRQISEEERKWFAEAVMSNQLDVIQRMKQIATVMQLSEQQLEESGVTVEELEGLLEELQEHVESIDMANDLKAIGGLVPLLAYLKSRHSSLRWKAADVVTTVVQNNSKAQQNVMDVGGLPLLLDNFTSGPDIKVRTKALGAISSLIRHNKPGIDEFRKAGGFLALKEALKSDEPRFQRKALYVLQYLMQENPSDRKKALETGYGSLLTSLVSNSDSDVRLAALQALIEIAIQGPEDVEELVRPKDEENNSTKNVKSFKETLKKRLDELETLKGEEVETLIEERSLLDELWDRCFGSGSVKKRSGRGVKGESLESGRGRERNTTNSVGEGQGRISSTESQAQTPVLMLGGPSPSSSLSAIGNSSRRE